MLEGVEQPVSNTHDHHLWCIPKMTITDILSDLENKGFHKIAQIKKSTALDQVNLELECTNDLQNAVDCANKHTLQSFQLRLVMDEV